MILYKQKKWSIYEKNVKAQILVRMKPHDIKPNLQTAFELGYSGPLCIQDL